MGVDRLMPHWQVERDLEASGLPHRLVRPSFCTRNLAAAHRADIAEHDRTRLPAGAGRTSFVDTRDVAAVDRRSRSCGPFGPGRPDGRADILGTDPPSQGEPRHRENP